MLMPFRHSRAHMNTMCVSKRVGERERERERGREKGEKKIRRIHRNSLRMKNT